MRLTRILAFLLVCIFALLFVLIHFIRTDLYFLKYPLSRYTIGEYGLLMSFGLLCFGLSEILLGYNIIRRIGKLNPQSVSIILAGAGVFLATFFSMDLNHKPTVGGNLHFLGAIVQFTVFPVFCLFGCKNPLENSLKNLALIVSIFTLLLCFLMLLSICLKNDILFSLSEKTDILIFTVWLLVVEKKMIGSQY
jgi:hypothetical protein